MTKFKKNLNNGKRNKTLIYKISMVLLFTVLGLAVLGGGYVIGLLNKTDNIEIDKENLGISENEFADIDNAKEIKNIALFGVDSVDGGTGRSDSIMIATIDPIHNKLKVTSLMRDSYVNIDGQGNDKLNHAYAFGGPQLSIKTINENFGLNIEDFASVNFSSLPKIIDILGGIDLNITSEELEYINGYISDINVKDGTNSPRITSTGNQHVNGVQALAYSRIRYTSGGDYERTQRHRVVLSALFDKLSTTSPSSYPSILNNLLPYVQTSMSATDILSLGTKVLGVGNGSLEQERFPRDGYCEGKMINGVYYLTFDKDITKQQIRDYIFEDK